MNNLMFLMCVFLVLFRTKLTVFKNILTECFFFYKLENSIKSNSE